MISRLHGHGADDEYEGGCAELFAEYIKSIRTVLRAASTGKEVHHATEKLLALSESYATHVTSAHKKEQGEMLAGNDFYDITKVDNHIHLSGAMTAQQLKSQMLRSRTDASVRVNTELIGSLIDTYPTPFDDFNARYNPMGSKDLRTCFLKEKSGESSGGFTCRGNYARLARTVAAAAEKDNVRLELRVSIYCANERELESIAEWFTASELHKLNNVLWILQIPRVPHKLIKRNVEMHAMQKPGEDYPHDLDKWLDNFFGTLMRHYMKHPKNDPSCQTCRFLEHIRGFDSVDDESLKDTLRRVKHPTAASITKALRSDRNPHTYSMYILCMWHKVGTVNRLLRNQGRQIFSFRPHCGELGSFKHLWIGYMCTDAIMHGVNLVKPAPGTQAHIIKRNASRNPLLLLYIVDGVGCALAPSSNAYLARPYDRQHLALLHSLGLNMSICTDDPLQFLMTQTPLIEQFSIVRSIFYFSVVDLHELAFNSCVIAYGDKALAETNDNKISSRLAYRENKRRSISQHIRRMSASL